MNLKKELGSVMKTGKVVVGHRGVCTTLLNDNPKLILLSNDCPRKVRERIVYYCRLSETPYHISKENSAELGSICRKPFSVSTIGIMERGESNILEIRDFQ